MNEYGSLNPYGVNTSDSNLVGPLVSLRILHEEMPKTTGCDRCKEVNGDNVDWCCKTTNPSMYYVEFLNSWQAVQDEWSKDDKLDLVVRAIRNYLSESLEKGCIFYHGGCTTYDKRPFACRMYGVIPKQTWDERRVIFKGRYGEDFEPRAQCDMVTADKEISREMEDNWFLFIRRAEERIGVPEAVINGHDEPHGSYRTFHDHMLVELFPPEFLNYLTKLRLSSPSEEDIDKFIIEVRKQMSQGSIITT